METQTVIIAHGPCHDGYGAVWSYWRTLSPEIREALSQIENMSHLCKKEKRSYRIPDLDSEETPISRGTELLSSGAPYAFVFINPKEIITLELVQNRDVIIFDLDLTKQFEVFKSAKSVMMIDHHISGEENI